MPSWTDLQADLQAPWYGGLGINEDVGAPGALPVAIGGMPFLIDPKKYQRAFVDAYRVAQDTSDIPGEQTLTTEGVWNRYGRDWRYGAGQDRFDRPGADRRRFDDSLGVDIWTEGRLSLLTKTEKIRDENKTYVRLLTSKTGQLIVVRTDGVQVGAGTWPSLSWSNVTGTLPVSGITDATLDDDEVWVATTTGVWSFPLSTLVSARYDGDVSAKSWDSILMSNGRLVGGAGNTLWEISTAASNDIHIHPSPAFRWTTLFGHPNWIYGGGTIGSVSELFRFGNDEATGAILPGVPSLTLPGGEILRSGIHYVKTVIITTSKGVRLCDVSNGELSYGRVISQVGDSRCVTAFGDYVWFGWTGIDTSRTGVGRCAPGRFGDVEGAVPAWARDVWWEGSGTVSACTVHAGRIVFAVNTVGVVIANDELVAEGWLQTGVVDFDIPYTIQPLDLTIRTAPLEGSLAVQWRVDGDVVWSDLGTSTVQASRISPQLTFPHTQAAGIELRLTLTRLNTLNGPEVLQWLMRASPQPNRVERIKVPLVFADRVHAKHHNYPATIFDVLEAWRHLTSLIHAGAVIIYQEPHQSWQVTIKDLQLDDVKAWSDDDRFFLGTVNLILDVVR